MFYSKCLFKTKHGKMLDFWIEKNITYYLEIGLLN